MGRVEDFLRLYQSKSTIYSYRWGLTAFFKAIYGENEEKLEELGEQYFKEKRDYEKDIQDFFVTIKGRTPKSVRLMLTAVRSFLIENDVELSQKFWRRLRKRIKGSRALTLDRVPSNVQLRRLLMHMPVQGKALFLVLASSGMRIGEGLQLKLEDVELDKEPCKVSIRGEYTKTGNPRIAFISKEAKVTIQEWLKVRPDYLTAASRKSHLYGKGADDPRLFPFEATTAYVIWKNALKKAGLKKRDPSTNRHKIHPHVLRKFFRTRMATLIPVDVVEALMGHEGYLTEVYRRYSMEQLAKFYSQGESALLVFAEAEEVSKLRVEVEQKNKQLQTLVNGLTAENLELKNRVSKMETDHTQMETENLDLRSRIDKTEETLADLEKLIRDVLQEE